MVKTESRAVAIARKHVAAWAKHDWEAARALLTDDVKVKVNTTQPIMAPVDTTGIDPYMEGLIRFAQGVVTGTENVLASTGDNHSALLIVTVEADFAGRRVSLPAARLYLVNDEGRIASEQVVFYAAEA